MPVPKYLSARSNRMPSQWRQNYSACLLGPIALAAFAFCCGAFIPAQTVSGQTATIENQASETGETKATDESKELISKLEKYLSGAQLKGRFTIIGRDFSPKEEQYTIVEAKKLEKGDYWSLKARIKYGEIDQTIPLVLQIKWADKTPVITLEKMTIPGMGTFSARVLFNSGMYSGTWKHDEVGGHLFGEVIPKDAADDQESKDN